ncbi:Thymidine kinase [Monocercomonoides exilis]|uniref:Thymidine kinase n=1 Tax=Monocercomonoides exilis TaxID=2049356 RepID=UPI0035593A0C|nr:Thymidine kinase [Monocercomonoides exilis]|eukprot:MONOS_3110.1-p1 / transcript=MONOS_3110.1 / gene=MONOS_3110 / organism=Monocercomonoides_exilis_PA203 / gene_product=Thymidine kinase [EC:2.7.1.21] / transcript_product=Thymidine kinase [EC:2.7.1.21] / location=Mono_scaffold00070:53265-53972(-) / protein_length=236 / sequence_SO=supercontig / SO=protein_coding / is_pseudo=false
MINEYYDISHAMSQRKCPPEPCGSIELIIGPMFSGKTTELIRRIRRHSLAKRNCIVIKYSKDRRYSEDKLCTHDHFTYEAISCIKLKDIEDLVKDAEIIGIDEGQFYPDLVEFCEMQANSGKIVIVAALDGTFQRKRFNDVVDLIPLCESVEKLNAVCTVCGRAAAFTKRLVDDDSIELVGGAEVYTALCRKCFFEFDEKMNEQMKGSNFLSSSPECKTNDLSPPSSPPTSPDSS